MPYEAYSTHLPLKPCLLTLRGQPHLACDCEFDAGTLPKHIFTHLKIIQLLCIVGIFLFFVCAKVKDTSGLDGYFEGLFFSMALKKILMKPC